MYRPTYAIDAIGRNEPVAIRFGLKLMGRLLWCLTLIDMDYLREFPEDFSQSLYQEGIVYGDEEPEPGTACGDDDWRDLSVLYRLKVGDCEELAAARCAELRVRWGVDARPMALLNVKKRVGKKPKHLFHILVRWPETLPAGMKYPNHIKKIKNDAGEWMLVEDPAEVLGMPAAQSEAA
jgi:hypothetical protein